MARQDAVISRPIKRQPDSKNNRAVRCRTTRLRNSGVEWAGWRYLKLAAALTLLQLRSDALAHVSIGRHRFHDVIELIDLQA